MIKKIILEKKPIYIIADLHGFFNSLKTEIVTNKSLKDCVLICAGDIGIGFDDKEICMNKLEELNALMHSQNVDCIMIRGNHDDPSYFNGSISFPNLKLIQDYTVLACDDINILCVGGAISIDRMYRKNNYNSLIKYMKHLAPNKSMEYIESLVQKTYWDDEAPILNTDILKELHDNNIIIQYIITHTSPSFAFKNDRESISKWIRIDENLNLDLSNERTVMDNIYQILKDYGNNIVCWVYGHFHDHWEGEYDKTKFIALKNFDAKADIYQLL